MQEAKSPVFSAQQEPGLAIVEVKPSLTCGKLGMAVQHLLRCHACQDSSKLPARERTISLHSLRLVGFFGGFFVNSLYSCISILCKHSRNIDVSAPGAACKDEGWWDRE